MTTTTPEPLDIEHVIEQHANALDRMGYGRSIYSELLKHGREFTAQPLPEDIERGTPKECFQNCLNIADGETLIYCEGYGMRPELMVLIHHAWCIDEDERVVDPTWDRPEECQYFGVDFQTHYIWEVANKFECTGMTLETFLSERAKEEDDDKE